MAPAIDLFRFADLGIPNMNAKKIKSEAGKMIYILIDFFFNIDLLLLS